MEGGELAQDQEFWAQSKGCARPSSPLGEKWEPASVLPVRCLCNQDNQVCCYQLT